MNWNDLNWYMQIALEEADDAFNSGEVPVGAIIVNADGQVLSQARNNKERDLDPCGHAEILVLRQAAQKQQGWRLNDCSLFVTLEPCPMCLAAMVQARIGHLYFGAYDPKGGAISLGYHLHKDKRLNHQFKVVGGLEHYRSSALLSEFFKRRRSQYKSLK